MHAAQPETQLYMSQLDGDRDLTCVRAFAQPVHLLFSLGSFEILDSVFTFWDPFFAKTLGPSYYCLLEIRAKIVSAW
jgi:hypothetical protein